jgi:ABC-type phosphate transport system permease subunit
MKAETEEVSIERKPESTVQLRLPFLEIAVVSSICVADLLYAAYLVRLHWRNLRFFDCSMLFLAAIFIAKWYQLVLSRFIEARSIARGTTHTDSQADHCFPSVLGGVSDLLVGSVFLWLAMSIVLVFLGTGLR